MSRAAQNNGSYQQPGHNHTSYQLPLNYQSPYGQGQQGIQSPQRQQPQLSPQARQSQQYRNALQQHYLRLSDINSTTSPYQADTSRRAHSHPSTANGLPSSSMPPETPASRPNVTAQGPAQIPNQQPSPTGSEALRKSIASATSEGAGGQRHPMPQAARPAAPNQIPQEQVSNEQAVCLNRPADHYNRALSRAMYPPAPDRRNSMPNAGVSSASSPKRDSHTLASPSTLTLHAHTPDVSAAAAQAGLAKGPDASTSPPKPAAAAPAIPASSATGTYSVTSSAPAPIHSAKAQTAPMQPPSTSKASPGPHVSSLSRKFVPHSTLSAPPRPGERPRPPERAEGQSHLGSTPPIPSASQITHSRWTGGSTGPTSHTTPSPGLPSSQQSRASDMTAPTSSAAQSAPPLSAPAQQDNLTGRTQSVRDTGTPNGHVPSGLPPVATTKRPSYTPVPSQRNSGVSIHRPMHQPGAPPTQQPPTQGHSEAPPPAKMRRMEDDTKHAVAPSSGAINLAQYAHQSPSRSYVASRSDIIQALDAQEADIKQSYDPSTIARDVLIATGRHPIEKPLNHHLEILRAKFNAVDLSSDLDTFRWDLVDPRVGARGIIPHRPPTKARPEARPPNHQHDTPSSLPVQSPYPPRSAPAPPPGRATAFAISYPPQSYSPQPTAQPRLSSFPHSPLPPPASPLPRPPPTTDSTSTSTSRVSSAHPTAPAPASAPAPAPAPAPTPAPASTPAPAPPPVTVPPRTPLATGSVSKSSRPKPTSSHAASTKAPLQSPRNKAYPQPQVVISSPEAMPPRKRGPGRPRKVQKNVEVAIGSGPNVPFPVFHCKWAKCQSELHNVRALEDHVLRAHVPRDLICAWEGCNAQTPKAAADMWAHVREKHIGPVAWALGDGPTVPATGENPEGALDSPTQASVLERCLMDMATSSG